MDPLPFSPARAPYAGFECIGIPRALMYYRYGALWEAFFHAIGRQTVLSEPTDRSTVERGDALSNDECCLASKIYLGHVDALKGRCDAVFAPSMANVGHFKSFCTKFQALPDLVANTFPNGEVNVVSCLVNETEDRTSMKDAFLNLAAQFGVGKRDAKRAWKEAAHAQEQFERAATQRQARQCEQLKAARTATTADAQQPIGILLAAHPYLLHDAFMGGALADMLNEMGVTVLHTDESDRKASLKTSFEFSETLPWIVNREIIGSIMHLHELVDGIVLVSAFPCGPDSMTDDAIMRCIEGKPILNLTIDAQSGTAGLETRIESFVDILRYQKKGGYVHAL